MGYTLAWIMVGLIVILMIVACIIDKRENEKLHNELEEIRLYWLKKEFEEYLLETRVRTDRDRWYEYGVKYAEGEKEK